MKGKLADIKQLLQLALKNPHSALNGLFLYSFAQMGLERLLSLCKGSISDTASNSQVFTCNYSRLANWLG